MDGGGQLWGLGFKFLGITRRTLTTLAKPLARELGTEIRAPHTRDENRIPRGDHVAARCSGDERKSRVRHR